MHVTFFLLIYTLEWSANRPCMSSTCSHPRVQCRYRSIYCWALWSANRKGFFQCYTQSENCWLHNHPEVCLDFSYSFFANTLFYCINCTALDIKAGVDPWFSKGVDYGEHLVRVRGALPPEGESLLCTFIQKRGQKLWIWMKQYKAKYARLCYVIGLWFCQNLM